jgi:hypothetical protein
LSWSRKHGIQKTGEQGGIEKSGLPEPAFNCVLRQVKQEIISHFQCKFLRPVFPIPGEKIPIPGAALQQP